MGYGLNDKFSFGVLPPKADLVDSLWIDSCLFNSCFKSISHATLSGYAPDVIQAVGACHKILHAFFLVLPVGRGVRTAL